MVYATVPPVPVMFLAECLGQIEAQNWEVRFVLYAGSGQQSAPLIDAAARTNILTFPVYCIIACKESIGDMKIEPPIIKYGGQK